MLIITHHRKIEKIKTLLVAPKECFVNLKQQMVSFNNGFFDLCNGCVKLTDKSLHCAVPLKIPYFTKNRVGNKRTLLAVICLGLFFQGYNNWAPATKFKRFELGVYWTKRTTQWTDSSHSDLLSTLYITKHQQSQGKYGMIYPYYTYFNKL